MKMKISSQLVQFQSLTFFYLFRHYQTFNVFNAQYVKLTPPAIRTNTDYAIIFNTDSKANIETFHEDFAGKMDKNAFINLVRKTTEEVPHGFLCIDNDPNVPYTKKFYAGVAEELPVDLEHIVGCRESWAEDLKQLEDIGSGKMADKLERIRNISKRDGVIIPEPSIGGENDNRAPEWDTSEYEGDPLERYSNDGTLQEEEWAGMPPSFRAFLKRKTHQRNA